MSSTILRLAPLEAYVTRDMLKRYLAGWSFLTVGTLVTMCGTVELNKDVAGKNVDGVVQRNYFWWHAVKGTALWWAGAVSIVNGVCIVLDAHIAMTPRVMNE